MIDRYTTDDMRSLQGRQIQAISYLRVLAAVANAQGHTEAALAVLKMDIAPEDWAAYEAETNHETAAFVDLVRDQLDPEHRSKVYVGLTSSNLQDTAEAILWNDVISKIIQWKIAATGAIWALCAAQGNHRMARTHGRDTELSVNASALYQRAARDLGECLLVIKGLPLRASLGGPVGGYSRFLTQEQAQHAADDLDVELDAHATQTSDRHRLASLVNALVQVVGILEQVATYQRLSAISGVDYYVENHVDPAQKGSSSMPHKRNPITSERICGLARVARGYQSALMETCYTQWWERDLTNSSVERVAWRDLVALTDYVLDLAMETDVGERSWSTDLDTELDPEGSTFYRYNQAIVDGLNPNSVYLNLKG